MALTPSTYSEPRSYSVLLTRPTHSFSRTPGRRNVVELLVGGVDHRAGLGEQADLVGGLDPARLEEHLLAVDDARCPRACRASQDGHLDHVDAEWLARQAVARRGRRRSWRATSSASPAPAGWRPAGSRCRLAHRSAAPLAGERRAARRATGCTAGGAAPPSRSPRRSDRRPAGAGRSGSACPSPTCRCGWRSCSGCWRSRSDSRAPRSTASSSACSRASRSVRSRSMSMRSSQSTPLCRRSGTPWDFLLVRCMCSMCPRCVAARSPSESVLAESSLDLGRAGRARRYAADAASRSSSR